MITDGDIWIIISHVCGWANREITETSIRDTKTTAIKEMFRAAAWINRLGKDDFDGQIYEYKVFVNNDKDCSKITRGWILSIDLRSMDFQSKCLSSTLASNLRSPSNVWMAHSTFSRCMWLKGLCEWIEAVFRTVLNIYTLFVVFITVAVLK